MFQLRLFMLILVIFARLKHNKSYVLFVTFHSNANVNECSSNLSPAGKESSFVSYEMVHIFEPP